MSVEAPPMMQTMWGGGAAGALEEVHQHQPQQHLPVVAEEFQFGAQHQQQQHHQVQVQEDSNQFQYERLAAVATTVEDHQHPSFGEQQQQQQELVVQEQPRRNPRREYRHTRTGRMIVERKIKVVTEQHNINKPAVNEGFPMKEWTVEIYILDQEGREKPARCFTKCVYNLHPSFDNPVQTFHEPPFKCTNEGWGEFEMSIDMYTTEKGGKSTIMHDLNFAAAQYENIHTIQFKNPSQALQQILRETGPLPSDEERKLKKIGGDGASKKKKTFDVEKMADGLVKLSEDDLLHVIQMIHDNKDDNTYTQNNIDAGEFSVDLYTLPDPLLKMLWDFLVKASVIS